MMHSLSHLLRGLAIVGMLALVLAVGTVVIDIVLRQGFGGQVLGGVDLVRLSLVTAVGCVLPWVTLSGGHVSVDMLGRLLPARLSVALTVIAELAIAAALAWLTWLGTVQARTSLAYGDSSQDLGIPLLYYWLPFLLGLGLSALAVLLRALLRLTGQAHKLPASHEASP